MRDEKARQFSFQLRDWSTYLDNISCRKFISKDVGQTEPSYVTIRQIKPLCHFELKYKLGPLLLSKTVHRTKKKFSDGADIYFTNHPRGLHETFIDVVHRQQSTRELTSDIAMSSD